MADTKYTTKQGQTVDLVCLAHYGRTSDVTEMVLEYNPGLAELGMILPSGTAVMLPYVKTKPAARELIDLWV